MLILKYFLMGSGVLFWLLIILSIISLKLKRPTGTNEQVRTKEKVVAVLKSDKRNFFWKNKKKVID